MTFEAFKAWMVENPKKACKGFARTSKILKDINPNRYEEIKGFLVDLCGKDQINRWIKEKDFQIP